MGDISAGLSYSVMKNALFKVIKIRDPKEIGEKVIVQGGTFLNDAVLRAFENLTGKQAYRPDVAGCMGCYGAALLARDRAGAEGVSTLLSQDEIDNLQVKHRTARCGQCSNNCLLTIKRLRGRPALRHGQPLREGRRLTRRPSSQAPNLFAFKKRAPLRLRAPQGGGGAPRHRRHPPRAQHVRGLPVLVHVLHEPGLSRGPLGPEHQEDLRGRHRVHALRERVLPGQALARPCYEPYRQGRRLYLDALGALGAQRRRDRRQLLQLPHRHELPHGPQAQRRRARAAKGRVHERLRALP